MVQSFDWIDGAPLFQPSQGIDPPGVLVPLGARGICIDSSTLDDPAAVDEVWVACLGQQLAQGGMGNGDSNIIVRIRDFPSRKEVSLIVLGEPSPNGLFGPATGENARGPFAITCSIGGDKYVACTVSNEVWKIPANASLDPLLVGGSMFPPRGPDVEYRAFCLRRDSVPGWPVTMPPIPAQGNVFQSDTGPISVSVDGNEKIWVQFKLANRIVRLNPSGTIELDIDPYSSAAILAQPETLGDFTGYYTAAALFPDAKAAQGGTYRSALKNNLNPFAPLPAQLPPCPAR